MQNNPCQNQTLSDLKTGEHAKFMDIQAEKAVASRLTSLGFTPGVEIVMNQNYGHGPLLVNVRGTRVALGRHEAQNITVQKDAAQ